MSEEQSGKNRLLVARLFKKTQEKSVAWLLNGNRDPMAELGAYRITLDTSFSGSGMVENLYIFSLQGELIEHLADESLDEVSTAPFGYESYYSLMSKLREMAFRQAVGADTAVDDILDFLK